MITVIRPMTKADIPALLRLVEEYWIFEDIAGFDPVPIAKSLNGCSRIPRSAAAGSPGRGTTRRPT